MASMIGRRFLGHVRVANVAFTAVLAVACEDRSVSDGAGGNAATTVASSGAGPGLGSASSSGATNSVASTSEVASSTSLAAQGGAAPFMDEFPDPACQEPEQGIVDVPTREAFVEQVVGRWMFCDGNFPFGLNDPGFEIAADGNFYLLKQDSPGNFERRLTLDGHGLWVVQQDNGSGDFPLELHLPGKVVYAFSTFSTFPRKMRIAQMAGPSTFIAAP